LCTWIPSTSNTGTGLITGAGSSGIEQFALIHFAAGNGRRLALSRLLLQHDSKVEVNRPSRIGGQTAIYLAAQNGHLDCIRCLINQGADVNLPDRNGFSPLYMAVLMGHAVAVQLLIDNGAYGKCCFANRCSLYHQSLLRFINRCFASSVAARCFVLETYA
jgi:hypothetical protein